MMKLSRLFTILAVGAAVGGAVMMARRISLETGKPLEEAFLDIPTETRRIVADLRDRAGEAIERGREAYLEKQQDPCGGFYEDTSAR